VFQIPGIFQHSYIQPVELKMSLTGVKAIGKLIKPFGAREDQFFEASNYIFPRRLRESVNLRRKPITIWMNATIE